MKIPEKYRHFVVMIFLFATLQLCVMRNLVFEPGPTYQEDFTVPTSLIQAYTALSEFLRGWLHSGDLLGHANTHTSEYPGLILIYVFYLLGANFELLSKSTIFIIPVIAGASVYLLSGKFCSRFGPRLIGGTFYMLTPLTFNWSVRGLIYTELGYALLPLAILAFDRALTRRGKFDIALVSILVVFSSLEVQYLAIICGTLLIYALVDALTAGSRKKLISDLLVYVLAISLVLLLEAFWIVPTILTPTDPFLSGAFGSQQSVSAWFSLSRHMLPVNVVRLWGFYDWIFEGLVNNGSPSYISFILVAAASAALLSREKPKNTLFLPVILLASLLLASGPNAPPPIGEFNLYLFSHNILFLGAFRDSGKFLSMAAASYAILLSISLDRLTDLLARRRGVIAKLRVVPLLLLALLILANAQPFFSHFESTVPRNVNTFFNLNGLQNVNYDVSSTSVEQWLQSQGGDFKVLWLPPDNFVFYPNASNKVADTQSIYSAKPGTMYFGDPFDNFILYSLFQHRTGRLAELLSIINVKYVVLRNDMKTSLVALQQFPDPNPTNYSTAVLRHALENQPDLEHVADIGNTTIYENSLYRPIVYGASSLSVVAGDLRALISLSYRYNISESPLVFLQDLGPGQLSTMPKDTIRRVFIQDNLINDVVFSFMPEHSFVNLAGSIQKYEADTWQPAVWWWYYKWEYTTQVGQTLLTPGNASIVLPTDVRGGNNELWVKAFHGPRNGVITFSIDNQEVGAINASSVYERFEWTKVADLPLAAGRHFIGIKSQKGENEIASMLLAPSSDIQHAEELTKAFLAGKDVTYIIEGGSLTSNPQSSSGASQGQVTNIGEGESIPIYIDNLLKRNYTLYYYGRPSLAASNIEMSNKTSLATVTSTRSFTEEVSHGEWTTSDNLRNGVTLSSIVFENKSSAPSARTDLKLTYRFSVEGESAGYWYAPREKMEWTKDGWLNLWLYGDSSGHPLQIYVYDSHDHYRLYAPTTLDWTGWRRFTILLNKPIYETPYPLDFNDIAKIRIWIKADPGVKDDIDHSVKIASFWFDKFSSSEFRWQTSNTVELSQGQNTLYLAQKSGATILNILFIESSGGNTKVSGIAQTQYQKVLHSTYKLNISQNVRFVVLSERFSAMWIADAPGDHVMVFSALNGYIVTQSSPRTIELSFKGDVYREAGNLVSLLTMLALAALLSMHYLRGKTVRSTAGHGLGERVRRL